MKLTIYQVDAFAGNLFGGNPAAVIPLDKWLDAQLMQQIALENNLSETVFFVPVSAKHADFEIKWFTPEVEINLCGHATLAAAYILFNKVMEEQGGYRFLDVSPRTITAKAHRPSYGSDGDYFSKPNTEDIVAVIREMMNE